MLHTLVTYYGVDTACCVYVVTDICASRLAHHMRCQSGDRYEEKDVTTIERSTLPLFQTFSAGLSPRLSKQLLPMPHERNPSAILVLRTIQGEGDLLSQPNQM